MILNIKWYLLSMNIETLGFSISDVLVSMNGLLLYFKPKPADVANSSVIYFDSSPTRLALSSFFRLLLDFSGLEPWNWTKKVKI